jgi:hypothetical protein
LVRESDDLDRNRAGRFRGGGTTGSGAQSHCSHGSGTPDRRCRGPSLHQHLHVLDDAVAEARVAFDAHRGRDFVEVAATPDEPHERIGVHV